LDEDLPAFPDQEKLNTLVVQVPTTNNNTGLLEGLCFEGSFFEQLSPFLQYMYNEPKSQLYLTIAKKDENSYKPCQKGCCQK
jgi:hypothetical protein